MMPNLKRFLLLLASCAFSASSLAMTYENRFLPLYARPFLGIEGTSSSFAVDLMAATASDSYGDKQDDKRHGLPEFYGRFDLVKLDDALRIRGCTQDQAQCLQLFPTDPEIDSCILLKDEWIGGELLWRVDGKLQMQGAAFNWHQRITDCFSMGANWLFMRVNGWHDYTLSSTNLVLSAADVQEVEKRRRRILKALGMQPGHWKEAGFGDVDLYARFSRRWDYEYKFRRIDAGLRVGALLPSGVSRDVNRPPSIPFGGDGFWGVYVTVEGLFELSEDLKIGLFARISKRFSRKTCRRVPLKKEPVLFGSALAQVNVNPGATLIFSPFVILENLRDGLGLSVHYTLVSHRNDSWSCVELLDTKFRENASEEAISAGVCAAEEISKWGSDYVSVNLFYDCGRIRVLRELDPIISLRYDVPAKLLVSNRSVKTHRLSFGIEVAF